MDLGREILHGVHRKVWEGIFDGSRIEVPNKLYEEAAEAIRNEVVREGYNQIWTNVASVISLKFHLIYNT